MINYPNVQSKMSTVNELKQNEQICKITAKIKSKVDTRLNDGTFKKYAENGKNEMIISDKAYTDCKVIDKAIKKLNGEYKGMRIFSEEYVHPSYPFWACHVYANWK